MELSKQPVTEMDYWKIIEGLGGLIWGISHDLGHDNIAQNNEMEVINERNDAIKITKKLVLELSEKFGVILPEDYPKVKLGETLPPVPEGKIYYRDWYEKRRKDFYTEEYGKIICSACPLSNGLDKMISLGGTIPCGAIRGWINNLQAPYECGMLSTWSKEELYYEIEKKAGKRILSKFQKRELELEKKFEKEKQE